MSNSSPTFSRTGVLFVLSAPSGAGKTTLTMSLRQKPDFVYAVSCTTRPPRRGEVDGEDYFFLSEEDFQSRIAAGKFLEHAEVHGRHYGTLKQTVTEQLEAGVDVLIDIDTQGRRGDPRVRRSVHQGSACGRFHHAAKPRRAAPPADAPRHGDRGANPDASRERRRGDGTLARYRYTLISGSMEEDIEKFRAVMRAERYLSRRLLRSVP